MSTPGRRKALRALARRKRLNKARMRRGLKPIVKGRTVSRLPSKRRRRRRG